MRRERRNDVPLMGETGPPNRLGRLSCMFGYKANHGTGTSRFCVMLRFNSQSVAEAGLLKSTDQGDAD